MKMERRTHIPFGFDRACYSGQDLIWVYHYIGRGLGVQILAEGTEIHRTTPPRTGQGETTRWVLSRDTDRVDTVRSIFRAWNTEDVSLRSIATRLNHAGKTFYDEPFQYARIRNILQDERYVDAIIDRETFDQTRQKIVRTRRKRYFPARDDRDFLKGTLICGGCARVMTTKTISGVRAYWCPSYIITGTKGGCGRNYLAQDEAEKLVFEHLKILKNRSEFATDPKLAEVAKDVQVDPSDTTMNLWRYVCQRSHVDPQVAEDHIRDGQHGHLRTTGDEVRVAQSKLTELSEQHASITIAWALAKSERMRAVLQKQIDQLQEEIDRVQPETIPLEDRVNHLLIELRARLGEMIDRYRELENVPDRQKAELIKAEFRCVILHFCPMKRLKSKMDQVRFVHA